MTNVCMTRISDHSYKLLPPATTHYQIANNEKILYSRNHHVYMHMVTTATATTYVFFTFTSPPVATTTVIATDTSTTVAAITTSGAGASHNSLSQVWLPAIYSTKMRCVC